MIEYLIKLFYRLIKYLMLYKYIYILYFIHTYTYIVLLLEEEFFREKKIFSSKIIHIYSIFEKKRRTSKTLILKLYIGILNFTLFYCNIKKILSYFLILKIVNN